MRSTLTLGIVFIGLAGLCLYSPQGITLTPVALGLGVLLVVAGVLVMLGLRVAFYAGLFAGATVAIAGILKWVGIGGDRLTLQIDPRIEVVLGLFLCFRVVLAEKQLGAKPKPARRPLSDELPESPQKPGTE